MDGPFKKLIVWQKAMELVNVVYALSKQFPAVEELMKKHGSIHCSPSSFTS